MHAAGALHAGDRGRGYGILRPVIPSVFIASFVLRLAAWLWSLTLLRRLWDWRVALLSLAIATAVVDGGLAALGPSEGTPWTGLATSLLAVVAVAAVAAVAGAGRPGIAHRTLAEKAVQASEERFSRIFHVSPDAIILSSFPDGRIFDVNEGFTETTGYSPSEATGRTSQDLDLWSEPDDRERLGQALRTAGRVRNLESEFRNKLGAVRTCLISAEVIELEGEPSVLTMLRDVSERKHAEQERENLISELEAKNAELERFSYTVSHDLKSPLVTIRGFLGLLERDAAAGDLKRMHRDAARIRAATEVMGRLLDELLELSRIGRQINPPEEVSLAELAREAADMVAGSLTERGVEVKISPALPPVFGDRARLLEVFQNLLENAVKYMGDEASPRVEIAMRNDGRTDVCCVRDNGMGIDPRYHEKVFGLFERLSIDQEGTGVGLALVKRIVEIHGGRIWVESEGRGTGSTFCFTVSTLTPEQAGDMAESDAPAA